MVLEKWFCKLGIFFLVNHFSRIRKKIRVCRTTFLQPEKKKILQNPFSPTFFCKQKKKRFCKTTFLQPGKKIWFWRTIFLQPERWMNCRQQIWFLQLLWSCNLPSDNELKKCSSFFSDLGGIYLLQEFLIKLLFIRFDHHVHAITYLLLNWR